VATPRAARITVCDTVLTSCCSTPKVHNTHLKDYFEATSAEALQQFFDLAAEYLRA
jgi:hypothetical protein